MTPDPQIEVLLERRKQEQSNLQAHIQEYEGKFKGSLYLDRCKILTDRIAAFDKKIRGIGKIRNLVLISGFMAKSVGDKGVTVKRPFETMLTDINPEDAILVIKYQLGDKYLSAEAKEVPLGEIKITS